MGFYILGYLVWTLAFVVVDGDVIFNNVLQFKVARNKKKRMRKEGIHRLMYRYQRYQTKNVLANEDKIKSVKSF